MRATEADIAQILDEAGHAVRDSQLRRGTITYAFAGLRVLPGGPGGVVVGQAGDGAQPGQGRHAVGGRRQVDDVPAHRQGRLDKLARLPGTRSRDDLRPSCPPDRAARSRQPERGRAPPAGGPRARHADGPADRAPPGLALRLARLRYRPASRTRTRRWPSASTRTGRTIWAQVAYARDNEWAETVDDVLRRRTTVTVRGLDTTSVRARVEEMLSRKA